MNEDLKDSILSIFEAALNAQLRAVRRSARGAPRRLAGSSDRSCPKLTWPMTYLKKPDPHSTSPSCWTVSTPLLASPSIAKVWSLPSPKRSPGRTVSCAPRRTPSGCVRGPLTLLAAFLEIAAGWRGVFPQSRSFQRAVRQAWARWCVWGDGACPASFGPTAARIAVGARSIFCTRAVSGSRRSCFDRFSRAPWLTARDGWWACRR